MCFIEYRQLIDNTEYNEPEQLSIETSSTGTGSPPVSSGKEAGCHLLLFIVFCLTHISQSLATETPLPM